MKPRRRRLHAITSTRLQCSTEPLFTDLVTSYRGGPEKMTTPSTTPQRQHGEQSTPILEARGLSRSFGHVRALNNADFDIYPGEVVALIGDNGAGKSTHGQGLDRQPRTGFGRAVFRGQARDDHQSRAGDLRWAWRSSIRTWRWPHTSTRSRTCFWAGRSLERASWPAGLHGRKGHAGKSESGLRRTGRHGPVITAPVGAMSGGQRQANRHCARDYLG